jgi:primosomal protein N' (replication factor Y)
VTPRVVRVLPDVPAIDKTFDYLVPEPFGDQVRVGTVVRIELHGRRVRGWVVADRVEPPAGVTLRPIAKVTGWGPQPDLLELADWAAWRWAGRPASLLRTATADQAVPALPTAAARPPSLDPPVGPETRALARRALEHGGVSVVRLPPAADSLPLVAAAAVMGDVLVLSPSLSAARHLGRRLRRGGLPTAILPDEWPAARAGASVVVGSRSAAWAPVRELASVVVLDEHDESYQQEQSPTWHARDVAVERARRAGASCLLVSPMPTLEAQKLTGGVVLAAGREVERGAWPVAEVIDLRHEEPGRGLLTDRLTRSLRSDERVVCVLNRKGRSRLLACKKCAELATCEVCDALVAQTDDNQFVCARCGTVRPTVCLHCGGTKFKNLRVGVSRLREEMQALAGRPVTDVTATTPRGALDGGEVFIGTEAVLHQVSNADTVAFIDLDQELLAPRYRAAEQALALLVRGARLLGGRRANQGGRLLLQTRLPDHEVVQAALLGDPARVSAAEAARREQLRYPPVVAMAAASGPAAPAFIEAMGSPLGVDVLGPSDGVWLLRAADHRALGDALAATPRPPGRLRVEVDPLRL